MVYLDNAATTKLDDEVLKAMLPYFKDQYFNASSSYASARDTKLEIEKARIATATLIGADAEEIIFTSGATEAINFALKGFVEENFDKGNHIITSKTEHKAVLNTLEYLETRGMEVTYLDVNEDGAIDYNELEQSITEQTALLVFMYVNNETGVIHDIKRISQIAKKHKITYFCDATQAVGKLPINVRELDIDLLCASAHKFNGPKGIGYLFKNKAIQLTPLLHGGSQEHNLRGGTYNTPLIVGLGKASELARIRIEDTIKNSSALNAYTREVLQNIKGVRIINKSDVSSPHIINFMVEGLDANIFIDRTTDLAITNGSACTSRIIESSHVLKAMGFSDKECQSALRISFDKYSTEKDVGELIHLLSI